MVPALVALLIIGYLAYWLFIRGNGWVILFLVFGVWGGNSLILRFFPAARADIMTFLDYHISYAMFIASVIVLFAVGKMVGLDRD